MGTGKAALARIWDRCHFSLDSLEERIKLQKTVYLLSNLGFNALEGYEKTYNWYVYGPYSPNVAKDAYDVSESRSWEKASGLSKAENDAIERLNKLLCNIPREAGEPTSINYELLGSLLFLSKKEGLSLEDARLKLVSKHDYLSDKKKFEATVLALKEERLIS